MKQFNKIKNNETAFKKCNYSRSILFNCVTRATEQKNRLRCAKKINPDCGTQKLSSTSRSGIPKSIACKPRIIYTSMTSSPDAGRYIAGRHIRSFPVRRNLRRSAPDVQQWAYRRPDGRREAERHPDRRVDDVTDDVGRKREIASTSIDLSSMADVRSTPRHRALGSPVRRGRIPVGHARANSAWQLLSTDRAESFPIGRWYASCPRLHDNDARDQLLHS
jgi:hypothetical protein